MATKLRAPTDSEIHLAVRRYMECHDETSETHKKATLDHDTMFRNLSSLAALGQAVVIGEKYFTAWVALPQWFNEEVIFVNEMGVVSISDKRCSFSHVVEYYRDVKEGVGAQLVLMGTLNAPQPKKYGEFLERHGLSRLSEVFAL